MPKRALSIGALPGVGVGSGVVPLPPGVEGGAPRDSLALRASLLAAATGRAPSKLTLARQRWLFFLGDYLLSLGVFVTLSCTWWRGAWNLFDYYGACASVWFGSVWFGVYGAGQQ
jgi:hypothetical protein